MRGVRYYDRWIAEQAESVAAAMRELGRKGIGRNAAVYVIPSCGAVAGRLVVAEDKPDGAVDVIRFPAQGTAVMAVPYSHLSTLLWRACRSVPILPTTEEPDSA